MSSSNRYINLLNSTFIFLLVISGLSCKELPPYCDGYYPIPTFKFSILDSITNDDILFSVNNRYFTDSIEIFSYSIVNNQIIDTLKYSVVQYEHVDTTYGYIRYYIDDQYSTYLIKFNYCETDTLFFEYLYDVHPCQRIFDFKL